MNMLGLERLEVRRLLANVSLNDGILSVSRDGAALEVITLDRVGSDIVVDVDGSPFAFDRAAVTAIAVDGNSGAVDVTVPADLDVPTTVMGGTGSDVVRFIGTEGDDTPTVTESGISGVGAGLAFSNIDKLEAHFGAGADQIEVSIDPEFRKPVKVFGGSGDDVFSVFSGPVAQWRPLLFGDAGSDTFLFQATDFQTAMAGVDGGGVTDDDTDVDRIAFKATDRPDTITLVDGSGPTSGFTSVGVTNTFETDPDYFLAATFVAIEHVDINASGDDDVMEILGSANAFKLNLDTGEGDDDIVLDASDDTFADLSIELSAGAGEDELIVRTRQSTPTQATILENMLALPALGVSLDIPADLEQLGLVGGSTDDTFTVQPMRTTQIGVSGNSQFPDPNLDTLALVLPDGVSAYYRSDSGPSSGTIDFTAGYQPVTYQAVRTITGVNAGPPVVTSSSFEFEQRQAIRVTFSEDVAQSLKPSDVLVSNLTTGATLAPSDFAISVETLFAGATRMLLTAQRLLPNGNYRATVPAGNVLDNSGRSNPVSTTLDFFVLAGDLDRDRDVDLFDAALLERNFGRVDNPPFSRGDIDYDGDVDLFDAALLERNFGTTLAPPTTGSLRTPTARPMLFAGTPIRGASGVDRLFGGTGDELLRPISRPPVRQSLPA